ncbi:hypothetical protein O5903_24870 [Escherichia coli]|nr:hypothetical protein [Escherichia coli]
MKIALVLRSGGDYNASDVQWLVNQLPKDYEIICLTDLKCLHVPGVKVIPLINQWAKSAVAGGRKSSCSDRI